MLLIDAEPIKKFIADGLNNSDPKEAFGHDAIEILAEIEYAPTVKVVRCKDCRHHHEISCLMNEWEQPDNSFCSGGERRASDE